MPLETKRQELKGSMQKFVGNLGQCLQQSYGNVTIETPDLKDEPPEILAKNNKLVTYLEGVIVSDPFLDLKYVTMSRKIGDKRSRRQ